ncbi:MAG: hypothetical protein PQJ58_10405 [Spirochaetales bacterium]|nr:hypothetical protein [Spirochaetales bacterium]
MAQLQYSPVSPLLQNPAILQEVKDRCVEIPMQGNRFVIFSDLHMGNGGSRDDFRRNAEAVYDVLSRHYYRKDYHLILNGDIEELQKFQWEQIRDRWSGHYRLFDAFFEEGRLSKTLGNHDLILSESPGDYPYPVHESIHIHNDRGSVLVYHGHQFSSLIMRFQKLVHYTLKYLAYPLGIMNYSKSPTSRKKLKTETRAYEASSSLGLISVIGHTHRPLFESLSKSDSLKYRLDFLIRAYRQSSIHEQKNIEKEIKNLQKELHLLVHTNDMQISELYSAEGLIPCLFNSGCTIGKRGFTALELDQDSISLVYWYDRSRSGQYINYYGSDRMDLEGSNMAKVVLNTEKLSYIQDKVRFMAPRPSLSGKDTHVSFQLLPD